MLAQSQSGKRGNSIQQQVNKKAQHNRAVSNMGDYISFDFNANETQPIHMANQGYFQHTNNNRIINTSGSAQLGASQPLNIS